MKPDRDETRDGAEPPVSAARQSRLLVGAVGSTLLAQMPPFLLGGVAVFAAQDIEMDELGVGAAVSVFFLASLATAMYGGRFVQLLGPRKGIYLGAAVGLAAMLAIAALVRSWQQLAVAMFVGGVANALAQPASNLALVRGISVRWQGMAFGVKQSAVPMVSLLAGASIPLVALTVGWRWAFVGGALLALLLILTLPRRLDGFGVAPRTVASVRVPRGTLRYYAIFGCLATISTTAVGTFLVGSLIDRGETARTAGVLLAVGSLAAIAVRLGAGWCVDRRGSGHLDLTLISATVWVGGAGIRPDGPLPRRTAALGGGRAGVHGRIRMARASALCGRATQ